MPTRYTVHTQGYKQLNIKGLKTCIMQIVLKKRARTFILMSDKIVTRDIL